MSLKTDPDPTHDGAAHEPATPKVSRPAAQAPAAQTTRNWSLAARLTAWYALSAFILILLATSLLYWALFKSVDRGYDLFLADKARFLSNVLQNKDSYRQELTQEIEAGASATQYARVAIRILNGQRRVVLESPNMRAALPLHDFGRPQVLDDDQTPLGSTLRTANGTAYRAMAVQVHPAWDAAQSWTIQMAISKLPERQMLAEFRRTLTILLIVALLACAVVGYEIARQGIRPIRAISAAARRVRSTTLHERIERPGLPAELSDLADNFNDMLDRLENAFDRLNRFSADIAHELRTPISNLRGQMEVALNRDRTPESYRQTLDSCLEESIRLSRIIDSLLFLARADNPRAQLHTESVNILQELQSVRDFYEAAASEAGVKMTVTAEPDLQIKADRTLLQRAIGNLVGNALRHTPAGGEITLSAIAIEGDTIRIQVADTGSGIPPEHLPHVLDRFYRADRSRSSLGSQPGGHVGLGLAIVAGITTMHGGHISIQSELGKGTRVTLDFPAISRPLPSASPRT